MNRRKIFYQNDDVHNLIESERDSTVLRAGPSVLAQSDSQGTSQSTLLLGSDQQASPIFEADDRPSASAYTPYGAEEASRSWIGFTGAARDDVLMGYLLGNGYRLYNPVLMRFCSPDSFSPFIMMNSYAYCEGDPVNSSDPSGHMKNLTSTLNQRQIKYKSLGLPPFSEGPDARANMSTLLRNNMWSPPTFYPLSGRRASPATGLHSGLDLPAGSAASTSQSSRLNLPIGTNSSQTQKSILPSNASVDSKSSAPQRLRQAQSFGTHSVKLTERQAASLAQTADIRAQAKGNFTRDDVADYRRKALQNFRKARGLTRLNDVQVLEGVPDELKTGVYLWLNRQLRKFTREKT